MERPLSSFSGWTFFRFRGKLLTQLDDKGKFNDNDKSRIAEM